MSTLQKEVLRNMITGGNLKISENFHSLLKDMLKDTLQEMLEAELGHNKRKKEQECRQS